MADVEVRVGKAKDGRVLVLDSAGFVASRQADGKWIGKILFSAVEQNEFTTVTNVSEARKLYDEARRSLADVEPPFDYGEKKPDGQYQRHPGLPDVYVTLQPIRKSYIHEKCKTITSMPAHCARTYAVDPSYYTSTFCCNCRDYFPTDEFVWPEDGLPINKRIPQQPE